MRKRLAVGLATLILAAGCGGPLPSGDDVLVPTATPSVTRAPKPKPVVTIKPKASPKTTSKPPTPTRTYYEGVHPGAFCSPHWAWGHTSAGTLMRCKPSATDSRFRWRAA